MTKPSAPPPTDLEGNPLPADPDAADVEQIADRLRVIPGSEVPDLAPTRFSPEELEQRRRRALGR